MPSLAQVNDVRGKPRYVTSLPPLTAAELKALGGSVAVVGTKSRYTEYEVRSSVLLADAIRWRPFQRMQFGREDDDYKEHNYGR